MHHQVCLAIAVILVLVGLMGLMRAMKDKKETGKVSDENMKKQLEQRDMQYTFVSGSSLVLGAALLVTKLMHKKSSSSF